VKKVNPNFDRLTLIKERYKNAPTRKLGLQVEVVNVDKDDLEWLIAEVEHHFFQVELMKKTRSQQQRRDFIHLKQLEEQNRILIEMLVKKNLSEPLILSAPEGYVTKVDKQGNITIEKKNKATEWEEK
jgi:hypothetical protein